MGVLFFAYFSLLFFVLIHLANSLLWSTYLLFKSGQEITLFWRNFYKGDCSIVPGPLIYSISSDWEQSMGRYVRAEDGKGITVVYTDEFGGKHLFSGGTRTWRNHNPGNVRPGEISKKHGAIGVTTTGGHGKFAVFPDIETGRRAMVDALKTNFPKRTIRLLVKKYAPKEDGNNEEKYTAFLQKQTGIYDDKILADFTEQEFEKLCAAIERYEGYKEGGITKLDPLRNIISVRKDKMHIIIAYQIELIGWVAKIEAIRLTQKGLVNAVVCTSKNGNQYLRCFPHNHPLGSLGE